MVTVLWDVLVEAATISELDDRLLLLLLLLLFVYSFALECCEDDNVVKEGDGHISFV